MNPVVIIPTFIYPRRHRGGTDVVATYDHPTAPNQPGELGRCLASLEKVEGLIKENRETAENIRDIKSNVNARTY